MKKRLHVLAFVTATAILAGCGGGGTSATLGPTVTSVTYAADTQRISYSDGTTTNNTATSSAVTWGSDHVTKTTTYTFANGGTNAVVATVPGVAGTPTYSGNTQTIVTTYGDGTSSTANNTATSSAVTWGS